MNLSLSSQENPKLDSRFKWMRITSKDKQQAPDENNGDFRVSFNDSDLNKVKQVIVQSVSIPNVFPNIEGQRLAIAWEGLGGAPTGSAILDIPTGFYTTNELLASLKTFIETAIVATAGTVDFTQDPVTSLITFTTTNLDDLTFISEIDNPLSSLAPFLGIIQTVNGASGTFQAPPALYGERMVYVHSQDVALGKTRLSNGRPVSGFVSIPNDVQYGQVLSYRNFGDHNDVIVYQNEKDLTNIAIKIRSETGKVLTIPPNHHVTIVLKVFY